MDDKKFWLDGACSLDAGIRLQNELTFGQATPRVTVTSIPGRSGDLHMWDGSYSNVTGTAKCFALDATEVAELLPGIAEFLCGGTMGYRRLETEEEPDIYRMARVENLPETEIRVRRLAPFNISFDCMPQKFYKSGEWPITVSSGDILRNPTGQAALPLVELVLSGDAKLQIGQVQLSIDGYTGNMVLDCELQDAYKDGTNLNQYVTAPEFPALGPGENQISWTGGVDSCVITPRWWTL